MIFGFGCHQTFEELTFERSEIAMGTVITLKANGANAQAAIEESFRRITTLEETITADILKIETTAGSMDFIQISEDTYKMLKTAQEYSQLTNGAFDVMIGAAVELWNISENSVSVPKVPSREEIEIVKQFVGYEHLHLIEEECSARLDLKGVKIDLGALAKGYAADLVRRIYIDNGITDGLIDFGTSTIYAFSSKRIGLKNPRQPDTIYRIIEVKDAAISTSGDYIKYFIVDGRRYHHIIDPRTCKPSQSGVSSVSVIVDGSNEYCAMIADILSTAAFINPTLKVPNAEFIIIKNETGG
ncbi:MAG: FAD:protein FMN transferase [Selenomonadaceae bacterium]|nr:FAD:protein FMN transferase [Selenomonadaceae bacterium]